MAWGEEPWGEGAASYPGFWDLGAWGLPSESLILPLESAGPSREEAGALPASLGWVIGTKWPPSRVRPWGQGMGGPQG